MHFPTDAAGQWLWIRVWRSADESFGPDLSNYGTEPFLLQCSAAVWRDQASPRTFRPRYHQTGVTQTTEDGRVSGTVFNLGTHERISGGVCMQPLVRHITIALPFIFFSYNGRVVLDTLFLFACLLFWILTQKDRPQCFQTYAIPLQWGHPLQGRRLPHNCLGWRSGWFTRLSLDLTRLSWFIKSFLSGCITFQVI